MPSKYSPIWIDCVYTGSAHCRELLISDAEVRHESQHHSWSELPTCLELLHHAGESRWAWAEGQGFQQQACVHHNCSSCCCCSYHDRRVLAVESQHVLTKHTDVKQYLVICVWCRHAYRLPHKSLPHTGASDVWMQVSSSIDKQGWKVQQVEFHGSHQGVGLPSCAPNVAPPGPGVPKYPVPVPHDLLCTCCRWNSCKWTAQHSLLLLLLYAKRLVGWLAKALRRLPLSLALSQDVSSIMYTNRG